ncbi:hypothetical protein BH24CHL4_BH24CHL4_00150 [soil metagenome]
MKNEPGELNDRILKRFDRDGSMTTWIQVAKNPISRVILKTMGRLSGADVSRIFELTRQFEQHTREMEESVRLFAPLGWAPTGRAHHDSYREALALYHAHGKSAAEDHLVDCWNIEDCGRLRFAVMPIHVLFAGHDTKGFIGRARWRLVEKALEHHRSGAYEASIPIILAQIDGVVQDLTKKSFFNSKNELMQDDQSLLGLPESLEPVWRIVNANVTRTQEFGDFSRHAILHGRELAYDSLINSTKAFVLLAAVLEWAMPKSRTLVEESVLGREQRFAGNDGVDESGRRLDRRGFETAKNAIDLVDVRQMAEWNQRGRYDGDLERMFPSAAGDERLMGRDLTHLRTSQSEDVFWVWRVTPSGFCLGLAVHQNRDRWHYASKLPPVGGPVEEQGWRHIWKDSALPDW